MQGLNILTGVRQLAPIASQARHFPPSSGEADAKEERIHSFIILNTLLTISYAGFFATHKNLFLMSDTFMYV